MSTKFIIAARILADGKTFNVSGCYAWALLELVKAGSSGCTPIDNPGPRWSGYVHVLRHDFGLAIETLHEPHRGPFPGTHARYILRSDVEIVSWPDGPARAAA